MSQPLSTGSHSLAEKPDLAPIKGYAALTEDGEKIGSLQNFLVDESGLLRYVVVETGFWIFGKSLLVPAGLVRVNADEKQVVVSGLTQEQAQALPEYRPGDLANPDYERSVLTCYLPGQEITPAFEAGISLYNQKLFRLDESMRSAIQAIPKDAASVGQATMDYYQEVEVFVSTEQLVGHPVDTLHPPTPAETAAEGDLSIARQGQEMPRHKDDLGYIEGEIDQDKVDPDNPGI